MLTGNLVRVRHAKHRLVPVYLNPRDPNWLAVAEELLVVFRSAVGRTRGEIEADVAELIGDGQLVHQGLAKLLEDRCETEVAAEVPPDQVREAVFRAAAVHHAEGAEGGVPFDRTAVLAEVGRTWQLSAEQVDQALFADLRDEQRILSFDDIPPERLLHRYNVALAQAVLLRSTGMEVRVLGETPARFRQLFRAVKFHRLICTVRPAHGNGYTLSLDGPLSLFSSTQKYGLQLAFFLPVLLHCQAFELRADIRWGPQKKAKFFTLSAAEGLRSHVPDFGTHTPQLLANLESSFRSTVADWVVSSDPVPMPVEDTVWVPDFKLTHTPTGKEVFVEVLGFWRSVGIVDHYKRLRRALPGQFVLVISDQLRADEDEEFALGEGIYRYKRTPIAAEVAKVAAAVSRV